MSHTLFIADLHLCNEKPLLTISFLKFLTNTAKYADALYILGDLFDIWIGDDDPNPLHTKIAQALKNLNIPCFFIHGNRDFMISYRFAFNAGITILPKEYIIELYKKRLLIMHGDTLCTHDKNYQYYRKKIQQRWLQNLFLSMPINLRQNIAYKIYQYSKKKVTQKIYRLWMSIQSWLLAQCVVIKYLT